MRVIREIDFSKLRLFGMRALCRKVDRSMTKGGIALPDTDDLPDKKKSRFLNILEVVKLGDGEECIVGVGYVKRDFRFSVGDYVVVDPRTVQAVRVEGETFAIVDEDAALVVFEGDMEVS